jgi:hypothetical protein
VHALAPPEEKLPVLHAGHDDAPGRLYVLTGQEAQLERPVRGWKLPAPHGEHAEAIGAPMAVPKLPAVQLVHDVWPTSIWYVPCGQKVQPLGKLVAPVAVPNEPELHSVHAA